MFFRKALVRIRREYNTNPRNLFLYSLIAVLIFSGLGVVADIFLPFEMWGNLVRSLILIPTSAAMFILSYAVSLFLHYGRTRGNPEWIPYRSRFSPSWRRRIALVIAAFLAVAMYANDFRVGYTAISAVIVTIAIALFAFIRTTKEEANREELGLPDSRDTRYEQQMKKLEQIREENRMKKKQEQKERRQKFLHGSKVDADSKQD